MTEILVNFAHALQKVIEASFQNYNQRESSEAKGSKEQLQRHLEIFLIRRKYIHFCVSWSTFFWVLNSL